MFRVLARENEEIRSGQGPLPLGPYDPERRIVRNKRRREVRGMDDVAGATTKNRVELILADD